MPVPPRTAKRPTSRAVALAALAGWWTLWSWQPAAPLPVADTRTTGLGIGESAPLPGVGPGARVTLERVEAVRVCAGRWWPGVSTLRSGPVTRLTVTVHGVPELVGTVAQDSWVAVNLRGEAYTGESPCECDGSCEASPVVTQDGHGLTSTVLLETGGSLSGVGFTGAPGHYVEWDV